MRRELLRALGEWVHACEEVRANNMRLEGRARAEHNKRLVAVRRANAAKVSGSLMSPPPDLLSTGWFE